MKRALLVLTSLVACGGQPTSMPVADRGADGLRPVPDAQAFSPGPIELPPRPAGNADEVSTSSPGESSPGAPTPEPATFLLLAVGLAVLGGIRRKEPKP